MCIRDPLGGALRHVPLGSEMTSAADRQSRRKLGGRSGERPPTRAEEVARAAPRHLPGAADRRCQGGIAGGKRRRSAGPVATGALVGSEIVAKAAQRVPAGVGALLHVLVRLDVQVLPAHRAETGAIGIAEDLLGDLERDRVAEPTSRGPACRRARSPSEPRRQVATRGRAARAQRRRSAPRRGRDSACTGLRGWSRSEGRRRALPRRGTRPPWWSHPPDVTRSADRRDGTAPPARRARLGGTHRA